MKIAFDVDGVVLNSIEVILDHINVSTGSSFTPDDLKGWDLDPLGIDEETLWKAVAYLYTRPQVEPYEGAAEVLSKIHAATDEPLLFITGRHDPDTACRQLEVIDWPDGTPAMTVTGGDRDKRRYLKESGADFIIEDDVQFFGDYRADGVRVGLMVRPWNKRYQEPIDARFTTWQDLWDWFVQNNGNERTVPSG